MDAFGGRNEARRHPDRSWPEFVRDDEPLPIAVRMEHGGAYLPILVRCFTTVSGKAETPMGEGGTRHLTTRELEVAHLIASGADNAYIADRLVVSIDTVKTHVKHILAKMELKSRHQVTEELVGELENHPEGDGDD